jgi:hypothetical protein
MRAGTRQRESIPQPISAVSAKHSPLACCRQKEMNQPPPAISNDSRFPGNNIPKQNYVLRIHRLRQEQDSAKIKSIDKPPPSSRIIHVSIRARLRNLKRIL